MKHVYLLIVMAGIAALIYNNFGWWGLLAYFGGSIALLAVMVIIGGDE